MEHKTQPPEPSKQDYIHVRARRGQATDSHSLAERVIFFIYIFSYTCPFLKKMKTLQFSNNEDALSNNL